MNDAASLAPYALAVDDDVLILMDATDILTEAGFRTLEARSGEEALEQLKRYGDQITLLFTDVEMPGMDGFELSRNVAVGWPDIAIVVASGRVKPRPDDLPQGAHFIGKPFSADLVHGHLQEILPDGRKPHPLKLKSGPPRRD